MFNLEKSIAKFTSRIQRDAAGGCHIWTGPLSRKAGSANAKWSYGCCWFNGKKARAHRVAYSLRHGDIPAGMYVCHTCDNPLCVNADHLVLGTHQDNMADAYAKGRTCVQRGFKPRLGTGASHQSKTSKMWVVDVACHLCGKMTEQNSSSAGRFKPSCKKCLGEVRRRIQLARWARQKQTA